MRKKNTKAFKINGEYFIINLFIFVGIGLLSFVLFNTSIFNQFTQAFKDFTLTDIYYTRIINQDNIYKGPLVLVNAEHKSRQEIAFLLKRIEEGKPKVIGVDIIFPDKKDSAEDELLKQSFAGYNNIVLPYIASFDSTLPEVKNHKHFQSRSASFVNLIGEDRQFSTIRYYYPIYKNIPAFTTAIMQMYDSSKALPLLKKGDHKTEILYYGNLQNFQYQTFDEIMNPAFNTDIFKDKIIMLGYMGESNGTTDFLDEDRFFTPLNPRMSGRSHPDMYGSVVHANIIRMAIEKDYIYAFPTWLNIVFAFLLNWLLLPYFIYWYIHKPLWYHLMLVLSQFTISILFVFFTIVLYPRAHIKIESSILLIAVFFVGDFLLFYHHIIKYLRYKLKWNFHSKFFEGAH